ncbi:MAG: response regulator [Anaerolineae bacterium]|nr:response regulator [Anaerolineae bacterium]
MNEIPGPIMIIEDLPSIRDLLEMTLRYKGYQVFSAADGEEALEKLKDQRPSLIITDVLMPRMDGFSLVQRLRYLPATRYIPIIVISATYIEPEDKDFALKMGVTRFIEKPIDTEDFLLNIAETLTDENRPAPMEPLSKKEFIDGYRERLEHKLRYKSAQISRIERLLRTLPESQRQAFESMLTESLYDRDLIQQELTDLLSGALTGDLPVD